MFAILYFLAVKKPWVENTLALRLWVISCRGVVKW
jgi:hypothetical protein